MFKIPTERVPVYKLLGVTINMALTYLNVPASLLTTLYITTKPSSNQSWNTCVF